MDARTPGEGRWSGSPHPAVFGKPYTENADYTPCCMVRAIEYSLTKDYNSISRNNML